MSKVPAYRSADLRNVVLLGALGSGKTTLAEAILHRCGAISRMGTVEDASTVSDHEPEATAHHHSTSSTLLFATHGKCEVNLIDTPGHPELVGYGLAALPAVETALIVISAVAGIEHTARRFFHAAGEAGLARMIVINKIDASSPSLLRALLDELRATFGQRLHCMNLPAQSCNDVVDCFDRESGAADILSVADVHREIVESVVEVDDEKLEQYLAGKPVDLAQLRATVIKAMALGQVVPVVFTSGRKEVGVEDLLHILSEEAPSPVTGRARRLLEGEELVEIPCDPAAPFLAHVFKVTTDHHLGQIAMLRVLQGRIDGSTPFVCGTDRKLRKPGHVLKVEGRAHPELEAAASAGDLVAVARVEGIHVDQLLHDPSLTRSLSVVRPTYPPPMLSIAVTTASRSDDIRLGEALHRLSEEDPTFHFTHDEATHELVLSGLGELHLKLLVERLKSRFRLDVTAHAPTIPYRETISVRAEGHYRHKKQTGGAGQFGEVFLRLEPLPRGAGIEFRSEVFGGAIPTHFLPAVEKGAGDALADGVLAGFPVHDLRVVITDGKAHAVDSKEVAFRTAGKFAVRDALEKARPVLLEPLVSLEVVAPESAVGDVTADLKQLRGRIVGTETLAGGNTLIRAIAPLAELASYGARLRGITSGQGSFVMELAQYEPIPGNLLGKIVQAHPRRKQAAD